MAVDGVATIWLSAMLNEQDKAGEMTVFIHESRGEYTVAVI